MVIIVLAPLYHVGEDCIRNFAAKPIDQILNGCDWVLNFERLSKSIEYDKLTKTLAHEGFIHWVALNSV